MKIIEVINVSKSFNLSKKQQKLNQTNKTVIKACDNISFHVNKGEIYGLLGSNGAGKTTMLRMMATLIKPDSGDIIINNNSVLKNSINVRKDIAFLTSELKLEDFFTPNYLFDFYSNLYNVSIDDLKIRKEKLFKTFEIESFKEVKIGDLSTGMKQKVSLAISLVNDPDIIIFDEPTNGLDVLTAKVVVDFLLNLKKEGKTIIVSTHIFSIIEKISDRVGIIYQGVMQVEDDLSNILKTKTLENYFFDIYEKASLEDQI